MDWISDHLTAVFLGLAIVLGVAELASMDLILLMLAAGALAGMGQLDRGRAASSFGPGRRRRRDRLPRPGATVAGQAGCTPVRTCSWATASWSAPRGS